MKTILITLFGIMLITQACEDKPGYPRILSRPTIPNNKGINLGDTTLNYYDNASKTYPFDKNDNQREHNTNH